MRERNIRGLNAGSEMCRDSLTGGGGYAVAIPHEGVPGGMRRWIV